MDSSDSKGRLDIEKQLMCMVFSWSSEGILSLRDYLNKLLPLVRPGGLIVAHNITPQQADPKYVEAITTNSDLESVLFNGVSLTLNKR